MLFGSVGIAACLHISVFSSKKLKNFILIWYKTRNLKYVRILEKEMFLTSLSVNGLSDDRTKSIKSARGTYSSVSRCCLWRITFVPGVSTRFICSIVQNEDHMNKVMK
jgi:hypothetical protein